MTKIIVNLTRQLEINVRHAWWRQIGTHSKTEIILALMQWWRNSMACLELRTTLIFIIEWAIMISHVSIIQHCVSVNWLNPNLHAFFDMKWHQIFVRPILNDLLYLINIITCFLLLKYLAKRSKKIYHWLFKRDWCKFFFIGARFAYYFSFNINIDLHLSQYYGKSTNPAPRNLLNQTPRIDVHISRPLRWIHKPS